MWKKHFKFITDTKTQSVINKVSRVLTKRSVEHTIEGNCITSTGIPLILVNWDGRLYSRDNFVGINPFIFIDRLTIEVKKPETGQKTELYITSVQRRAYIPLIFIILVGVWVLIMKGLVGLFFLVVAIPYYLFVFQVVGSLLLREMERALQQTGRGERE